MLRRLFFSVPDVPHARRIVDELKSAGVEHGNIHASSESGTDLQGLPEATAAQCGDRVGLLDRVLWNGDLALFALATLGLVIAAYVTSMPWALAALAVMVASYVFGHWFFTRVPHTHLTDMNVPLERGEVVLMVDVPKGRLRETERLVSRHHPEVEVGGVGWSSPLLGT